MNADSEEAFRGFTSLYENLLLLHQQVDQTFSPFKVLVQSFIWNKDWTTCIHTTTSRLSSYDWTKSAHVQMSDLCLSNKDEQPVGGEIRRRPTDCIMQSLIRKQVKCLVDSVIFKWKGKMLQTTNKPTVWTMEVTVTLDLLYWITSREKVIISHITCTLNDCCV